MQFNIMPRTLNNVKARLFISTIYYWLFDIEIIFVMFHTTLQVVYRVNSCYTIVKQSNKQVIIFQQVIWTYSTTNRCLYITKMNEWMNE